VKSYELKSAFHCSWVLAFLALIPLSLLANLEISETTSVATEFGPDRKAEIRSLLDQAAEFDGLKKLDEELDCLNKAQTLLQQTPDDRLQCETYAYFSSVYLNKGNSFLSLEYAEKSRLIADRIQDVNLMTLGLVSVANANLTLRRYEDAIISYQRTLEYANQTDNKRWKLSCFNNMAICYWRLKNWPLSEKYLRLTMEQLVEGTPHFSMASNNLGLILVEQGRYDEGEKYMLASMKFNREKESFYSLSFNLSNLADLEVRRGRLDQAFAYANESLQYAEQSNNLYMKTRTYRHLAKAYMAQKDNVTAEEYLKMSLNCGREMGDKAEIVETMSALFDFYRSVGNYKEALDLKDQIGDLESEIINTNSRAQSILFDVRWETSNKERQIQLLLKEKELADLKARQQNLQMEKTENELESAKQARAFQLKIRNLMLVLVTGFGAGGVIMAFLFLWERKLRKQLADQKHLLNDSNQQLHTTNREKDEILAIVAHDLRNPLSAQMGLTHILLEDLDTMDRQEIKTYIEDMADSTQRMNEIITLLLSSRRLESSAIEPELENLQLGEIIRELAKANQNQLERKHQSIQIQLPEEDIEMHSDPVLLRQILDNLISNASKFSPPFRQIFINAELLPDGISIAVSDEGPGIVPEEQFLLFEKFSTTSNKPTAGEPSIGLGLSIVKQLVHLLKGRIWYEDNPVGGSRFCIHLPRD